MQLGFTLNALKFQTPPENLDLNTIENLWHELKHFLQKNIKPHNIEDLTEENAEFWDTKVTLKKSRMYIFMYTFDAFLCTP